MKLLALYCFLIFLFVTNGSCNRYIDKTTTEKKIPVLQGSFTFYPDSNVLFYKNKVGQQKGLGTETKYPKPYYIKVPKRLIWWEVGADTFVLNYKDKQVIAFFMDLFNDIKINDTAFVPGEEDIKHFLPSFDYEQSKFNLYNIPMIKGRKHYLINKGDAIILLYNILPSNYDRFIEAVNSFKFL